MNELLILTDSALRTLEKTLGPSPSLSFFLLSLLLFGSASALSHRGTRASRLKQKPSPSGEPNAAGHDASV